MNRARIIAVTLFACALVADVAWKSLASAAGIMNAIVHLDHLGISEHDKTTRILLYGEGTVLVGIGKDTPKLLRDTLTLDRLPAITADVSNGALHIEVTGPGTIEVAGDVTGGGAKHVGASGRHIVLMQHGSGIMSQ